MANLNQDQLDKALELILNHMKEQGLATENMLENKEAIFKNIKEQLDDKLSLDDIKNPLIQKKLMGAIINETLGLKQNPFLDSLTDPAKKMDPLQVHKNVAAAALLMKALIDMKMFNKNMPRSAPELKMLRDAFNTLKNDVDADKDNSPAQKDAKKDELNLIEKQLSDSLRNLYGGDDPRLVGEITFPVLGPIVGNLFGAVNNTVPDPNSQAYMVQAKTYNSEKSDPLGLENMLKLDDLMSSIMAPSNQSSLQSPSYTK